MRETGKEFPFCLAAERGWRRRAESMTAPSLSWLGCIALGASLAATGRAHAEGSISGPGGTGNLPVLTGYQPVSSHAEPRTTQRATRSDCIVLAQASTTPQSPGRAEPREWDPYDAKTVAAELATNRPPIAYSRDRTPTSPKLEDLPLQKSVSQYGITWTFDKPARVGRFINGDWYVVGPVTIKAIECEIIDRAFANGETVTTFNVRTPDGTPICLSTSIPSGVISGFPALKSNRSVRITVR